MKITLFMLVHLSFSSQNTQVSQGPYIFGTSINTKAVTNGNGVTASETTTHSLDDVSQSKAYANGDAEVNSRT